MWDPMDSAFDSAEDGARVEICKRIERYVIESRPDCLMEGHKLAVDCASLGICIVEQDGMCGLLEWDWIERENLLGLMQLPLLEEEQAVA